MSIKFSKAAPAAVKSPTFGDIPDGSAFTTDFGTVYVRTGDQVVKLGNPLVPSHNEVRVKNASYFSNSRPVTPVELTIAL